DARAAGDYQRSHDTGPLTRLRRGVGRDGSRPAAGRSEGRRLHTRRAGARPSGGGSSEHILSSRVKCFRQQVRPEIGERRVETLKGTGPQAVAKSAYSLSQGVAE